MIPIKGHHQMTRNLLTGIRRHQRKPPAKILIVNDGDEPFSHPGCQVIQNPGVGVTDAWNAGLDRVSNEYAILLNNDVECSGPFVEELIQAAGDGMSGVKWRDERGFGHMLEGWCLCFPKRLYKSLGGFDAAFRYYFQDTDFQLRARNRGVSQRVARVPLRHLEHKTAHDGKTLVNRPRLYAQDMREFRKRWRR